MLKKHVLLVIVSLLTLAILTTACSDDDPVTPPPDSDILLTLHLGEYFLEAFSVEGIVFASDQDGNLLDMATWNGPTTVVLKNTTVHPDTISFTMVQYNDWELSLATELGVPAGTVKTFNGYRHSPMSGSADVAFINAPDCEAYTLASNWGALRGPGPPPASRTFDIFGDSTNIYVRIDPKDSGPLGGWLRSLRPGDTDTFDFDAPDVIAPLVGIPVQIPPGGNRLSFNFHGSVITESSRSIIGFDWQDYSDVIPESVMLYGPEFDTSNLTTWFYQWFNGSPDTYYHQKTAGPVPPAFTHLEGDLAITSTSPDNLAFTTTSDWDRFTASWTRAHELYGHWWVEGPSTVQTFALPQIPEYLADLFPNYPVEGFELRNLEIIQDVSENMVRGQGKYYGPHGVAGPDPMELKRWDPWGSQ